jgi:hypothetical protein
MNETTIVVLQPTERRTEHFECDVNGAEVEGQRVVVTLHVVVVKTRQVAKGQR